MAYSIGLITATEFEFRCIARALYIKKLKQKKGFRFATCSPKGTDIVVIKTGVGISNARAATKFLIKNFNTRIIINTGIAGAIKPDLKIGDIIIGKDIIYDDTNGQNYPNKRYDSNNKIIKLIEHALTDMGKTWHSGIIVSTDKPLFSIEKKNNMHMKYNADAVDMEASGIIEVCNDNEIPFISIKSISDYADESSGFNENLLKKNGNPKIIELIKLIMFHPFTTISSSIKMLKNIHMALSQLKSITREFIRN